MKKKLIQSDGTPKAIGPYSPALKFGNFYFFSGQIGIDPATGHMVEGGIKTQTEQVFRNLESLAIEAGLTLDNAVKCTVFLKNMSDFSDMNDIYSKKFSKPFPARAAVEVSSLPADALIEIDMIALE